MKKRIVSLSICLLSSLALLAGCGKETVVEETADLQSFDDIYATEGETTEKKADTEELIVEEQVDTKALLENALKGITMVRMRTTINVDAAPTSKVETPEPIVEDTESNPEEVPNELEEITLDEAKEQGLTENPNKEDTEQTDVVLEDGQVETTSDDNETTTKEDKKDTSKKDTTKEESTTKKDPHASSLDAVTKGNTTKKTEITTEKTEEKTEETINATEEASVESDETTEETTNTDGSLIPSIPKFVETDAKNYFVNMSITTDIDTTTAKTYGTLKMDLGAEIDKEVASYDDFSLEPATNYIIKHVIEDGADSDGNPTEVVGNKWYKSESSFYGLATIREILEKSNVVSYNESVESHIISLDVPIDLALKLDVTNEIMKVLYEGKSIVPMTVYLTKADGILTKIVFTMNDFKGTLSQVDVQTKNYAINFEKHNSINRVMIPDTILSSALEITGEENFISDTDLVKYNFEKMAVEQAIDNTSVDVETTDKSINDSDSVSDGNSDKETSATEDTKVDDTKSDVDALLKNTQKGKGK